MSVNVINPSFNGFSLQDSNWITERIEFKGFAKRDVETQPIARREGIKVLASIFHDKEITLGGSVIASDSGSLQTLLDNMKAALAQQEATLIIEQGRQYVATVTDLKVPDQPYNMTIAQWEATFQTDDPFSIGSLITTQIPVVSGTLTVSGGITIQGSFYNRPTLVYVPPTVSGISGPTFIKSLTFYHIQSGQSITVSGFGSGVNLNYQSSVTIDMDKFLTLDGTTALNNAGAFAKWLPGVNNFTITADHTYPGGTIVVTYTPRYI